MNVIWSDSEKEYIKSNAATMTDAQLAKELTAFVGREVTLQAVRKQRQKMNLKKCRGRGICKLAVTAKPPLTSEDGV